MKTRLITLSLFTAATLFLFNCGGAKTKEADQEGSANAEEPALGSNPPAETAPPQFAVDASFQQQLAEVFTAYVSLKEAFVASDVARVKTEAGTTLQALAKADMKLLNGPAHNDWMNYAGNLEASLKQIQASDDMELQRESFSVVSDNLYKSIKAYGLGGVTAYYDFCPMAFNNQGGYWLSNEDKIRNPYFGDKMLSCGEVKDKLK